MNITHAIASQLVRIGEEVEQIILVVDLKGLKPKTLTHKILSGALKKIIQCCSQYFPEMLHKAYIVNAPMSFSQVWTTYEPLLPAHTKSKIRIIGSPTDPEITASVILLKKYHCYRFR